VKRHKRSARPRYAVGEGSNQSGRVFGTNGGAVIARRLRLDESRRDRISNGPANKEEEDEYADPAKKFHR
jgi:hypothetical protein